MGWTYGIASLPRLERIWGKNIENSKAGKLCAHEHIFPGGTDMDTIIQKIDAKPGQRVIAMSDIHGHPDCMLQLLRKLRYSGDDILVIAGDLIDKGPDSLQTVRYIMDLSSKNQVYVSEGNVDEHRIHILCDESSGWEQRFSDFLYWLQNHWHCGLIPDMLTGLGLSPEHVTPENAAVYRQRLLEHYAPEIEFLRQRPTILDMGSYIFVHGGIPTDNLDSLAGTDRHPWLKNDRFLEQGCRFSRCVVTGHWPACLYRHGEQNLNPYFDYERKIICMDGGCGIKAAGQLNALIFPDKDAPMENITWDSYDGAPLVTALEGQKEKPCSLYIQYLDNKVERLDKNSPAEKGPAEKDLEENDGLVLCRHISSGKELRIPACYLYQDDDETWHTEDYSDGELEVAPGDTLSAMFCCDSGCFGKKNGVLAWYRGKYRSLPFPAGYSSGESPAFTETAASVGSASAGKNAAEESAFPDSPSAESTAPFKGGPAVLIPGRPREEKARRPRETAVYDLLDSLAVPYSRIDHPEAKTMDACRCIDEILDAVICKNLFLRNQQATRFYLLMMPGDKKFRTKELSKQIGSARLSFAEPEYMETFLHISPGSVSVLGLMNDTENRVQLLIDRDVLNGTYFGCHPNVNTSSLRMKLEDLLERILPAIHHEAIIVDLKGE